MPSRPRKPCTTPGCGRVADLDASKCGECTARSRTNSDRRRGTSSARGYGHRHRDRFRLGVLKHDRICRVCRAKEATVADHWPRSRRELEDAGLDPDDPQYGRGLCPRCHSKETAQHQPGGWNRAQEPS